MHMQTALQTWRLMDLPHMDVQHHYLLQWNRSPLGPNNVSWLAGCPHFGGRISYEVGAQSFLISKVSSTDDANTNTLLDTQVITRSPSLQICNTKLGIAHSISELCKGQNLEDWLLGLMEYSYFKKNWCSYCFKTILKLAASRQPPGGRCSCLVVEQQDSLNFSLTFKSLLPSFWECLQQSDMTWRAQFECWVEKCETVVGTIY